MNNYLKGKGLQTTYEYTCVICGKKGTSRSMIRVYYNSEYCGMAHRKCKNKEKKKNG